MTAQALLAQNSYHLVDDNELAGALQSELSKVLGPERRVVQFERRLSDYYSSYVMEELDVVLDDGRELELIFKNLSRDGMLEGAIRNKPYFLYNPMREIETYRRLLSTHAIGTAKFYGAYTDPSTEHYWLFIERVPGTLLWQFGEDEVWQYVAGWLGNAHSEFAAEAEHREDPELSQLKVYDQHYYWQWMSRAHAFVHRTACGDGSDAVCDIEYLSDRFPHVVDRLMRLPTTVIHGEFYPSNVLLERGADATRVCPVDWETAAIGPGLMDLSALTSGSWTEQQRLRMATAYYDAREPNGDEQSRAEFLVDLDYCSLFMAIQWLGWSPDWQPPPEHAQNWLTEACRLTKKLGL
jgi:hypothetical protein